MLEIDHMDAFEEAGVFDPEVLKRLHAQTAPKRNAIPCEQTNVDIFKSKDREQVKAMLNGQEYENRVNRARKKPVMAKWYLEIRARDGGYSYPVADDTVWFSVPWDYKVFRVYMIICKFHRMKKRTFTAKDIYMEYAKTPNMSPKEKQEIEEIIEILRSIRITRYIDNPNDYPYSAMEADSIQDEMLLDLSRSRKQKRGYAVYRINKISPLYDLAKQKQQFICVNDYVWHDLLATKGDKTFRLKFYILKEWHRLKYQSGLKNKNLCMLLSSIADFAGFDFTDRRDRSRVKKLALEYMEYLLIYHDLPLMIEDPKKEGLKKKNDVRFVMKYVME